MVVERLGVYYLIEGVIVQLFVDDAVRGMSKIDSAEIGPDIWTLPTLLQ